ncbi:hypothetical protein ON010_g10285 [Phytophthora cinnamomi]|nr:hypothetical protein ON010_g10285 [Phytophthora cinnamomi]
MSRQWTEELEELLLDVTGRFVSWPERLQEFVNVLERREFTRMPTPPFTEEEMQTHFKEVCKQVPIEVCSTRSMTWSAKRTELLLSIDSNTPGESYEVKTVLFNQAVKEKGWTFSASLLQVKKKLMAISSRRNLTTSNSTQSAQPIQERVTQIQVANQVSSKRERQKVDDVRDKNPKHQKIVSNSSAAGATTRSSTAANSKRATAAAVAADNLLRGSASEKEHFCLSMNEFSGLESETENDGGATVNATARGKNDSAGGASSAVITPGHFGCKSVPIATMPVHSDDESGSEVGPSDETSDGTHEQGTSLEAEETGCTGQAETGIRAGALKKNEGGIVAVGTSGLGNMANSPALAGEQ